MNRLTWQFFWDRLLYTAVALEVLLFKISFELFPDNYLVIGLFGLAAFVSVFLAFTYRDAKLEQKYQDKAYGYAIRIRTRELGK